ncbi:MAG: hypothetical protein CMP20_09185 [Rickettsiales bacterium]|nr:hypothetical protein [Rickettsiales bacterium]
MGAFDVSVEVALTAFALTFVAHALGAIGTSLDKNWIVLLASFALLACMTVMPLVWALPTMYLAVLWRPPFHTYAMWRVMFYLEGLVDVLWLFIALPATIDPKSDGERSNRSYIYLDTTWQTVAIMFSASLAFCVSVGTVAAIHKHREVWVASVGRSVACVLCLSGFQHFVGFCVSGFVFLQDFVVALVFILCGWVLFGLSTHFVHFDERQPVFQGPGPFAAALTGLLLSFTTDATLLQLEVYQIVFSAFAWLTCALIYAQYLKRYQWTLTDDYNPIVHIFRHWVVNF